MKDPKLVAADVSNLLKHSNTWFVFNGLLQIPASLISHTSAWMDDKMKNLIDLNKFVMDGTQATVKYESSYGIIFRLVRSLMSIFK